MEAPQIAMRCIKCGGILPPVILIIKFTKVAGLVMRSGSWRANKDDIAVGSSPT
jgi:hypothetical protein